MNAATHTNPLTGKPATDEEALALANEVRALLQGKSCCRRHAAEIMFIVFCSFAKDDTFNHHGNWRTTARLGLKQWRERLDDPRFDFEVLRPQ